MFRIFRGKRITQEHRRSEKANHLPNKVGDDDLPDAFLFVTRIRSKTSIQNAHRKAWRRPEKSTSPASFPMRNYENGLAPAGMAGVR